MNKAVILDLDETLITTLSGRRFALHSDDWKFKLEILPFLKKAISLNYKIVVVTNQGGISQGFISEFAFNRKMENILTTLEKELGLKKKYKKQYEKIPYSYCKEFNTTYRRKPNPGMAYELAMEYELDLHNSVMVGDLPTDEQFATNAGIGTYLDITEANETYKFIEDFV